MFSRCAGKCHLCYMGDVGCIAGHGDDDFSPATKSQLLKRLVMTKYSHKHDKIRGELIRRYPEEYGEQSSEISACGMVEMHFNDLRRWMHRPEPLEEVEK